MQCVNCQFNNMPGNARCIRCGADLQLATAAIGVEPPRASSGKRWLRRGLAPLQWLEHQQSLASSLQLDAEVARRRSYGGPAVLARALLPGWAHFYLGYYFRARIVAIIFWPLLIASLAAGSTPLAQVLWIPTLAVHAASIIDLLIQTGGTPRERFVRAPLVACTIVIGFYFGLLCLYCVAMTFWTGTLHLPFLIRI